MAVDVPQIFVHWEGFIAWLFGKTAGFPARIRHSLTNRIECRALDIHEAIVEARFTRDRRTILARLNLDLDKLRLLLRLAHDLHSLDHRAFAHACAEIDTTGRMIGGWLRHERAEDTGSVV